mgnify:CR=1 FL=1
MDGVLVSQKTDWIEAAGDQTCGCERNNGYKVSLMVRCATNSNDALTQCMLPQSTGDPVLYVKVNATKEINK